MKKSLMLSVISLVIVIVVIFAIFLTATPVVLAENVQEDILTEQDLYNETNTYNINSKFDANGNMMSTYESDRKYNKQYKVSYDMSARNENEVLANGVDLYAKWL